MQFARSCKYLSQMLVASALVGVACISARAQEKPETAAEAKGKACPNDDSGLTLPAGFCATIFADNIGHARHMVVSPDGVVYVNTWSGRYYGNDTPPGGGFLVALQDKSGSGRAGVIERFGETVQTGGAGGTGIGLYKGALYAETNDRIVRYTLPPGAILPSNPPDTVVSSLPLVGDHPMHPFLIDAKGLMYVDVASATNSCQAKNRTLKSPGLSPCVELETRGGIWRYDANKTNQTFSPADRYATGIRNGEGFAIVGGRLFVTQHGRDQLHANWPDLFKEEEEATLPAEEVVLLKQGGDYGWPTCYYDNFQQKLVLAPEYGGDGGKKVGECSKKIAPAAAFPAHWAPNAMVHYDQKQFPDRYRNGVFIAFHGSWDRAPYPQQGYNVVFQPLDDDHATAQCEIFADGFAGAVKSPEKAEHRPSGLAVGPDGALYISDDVRGRVYRITYHGGDVGASLKYTTCPNLAAGPGEVAATSAKPPEGTHPDAGAAVALPVPPGATRAIVDLGGRIYHGQVGGAACTGCHGESGQGSPLGPDLTGKKWLWSDGSWEGIAKTIADGVAQPKQYRSPMPPMGGAQLTQDQVKAVAAYVWSISHLATSSSASPSEIEIPGERIFPESLTFTPAGRVIIGSIGTRSIFSVKPGASTAEPWIPSDSELGLGVFGVFADEGSNTLWGCCSSPRDSRDTHPAPSTLKAFHLQTGARKARYVLPHGASLAATSLWEPMAVPMFRTRRT
jgi:glucose/arabinose dehydrogenase/mono/diheme cytochrome c family protein